MTVSFITTYKTTISAAIAAIALFASGADALDMDRMMRIFRERWAEPEALGVNIGDGSEHLIKLCETDGIPGGRWFRVCGIATPEEWARGVLIGSGGDGEPVLQALDIEWDTKGNYDIAPAPDGAYFCFTSDRSNGRYQEDLIALTENSERSFRARRLHAASAIELAEDSLGARLDAERGQIVITDRIGSELARAAAPPEPEGLDITLDCSQMVDFALEQGGAVTVTFRPVVTVAGKRARADRLIVFDLVTGRDEAGAFRFTLASPRSRAIH